MFIYPVAELSLLENNYATKSPLHPTLCRGLPFMVQGCDSRGLVREAG